jgi:hypothetical protein
MVTDGQMTKVMASEFLHLKIRVNQIAVSVSYPSSLPVLLLDIPHLFNTPPSPFHHWAEETEKQVGMLSWM